MPNLDALIATMPKAELHMHLEGSIEPELMFRLARRNGITLAYRSEEALRAAYSFTNLQSFLDLYYAGLDVLRTERDFYDMTWAYLERVHAENVVHAEVMVSPQGHSRRGIPLGAVFGGIGAAFDDAQARFGMSARLIVGIQRQWSEDDALATIDAMLPFRSRVTALGLGGPEVGNPPQKFVRVFERARSLGWRTTAHAGEEGPAQYVADTVDLLRVDRIDHGVRCEEDPALVRRLAASGIPLTVCPVSNVKLRVFPDLAAHNLKRLLDAGVRVTINSDDPSYFGGYMNENYIATRAALGLDVADVKRLARASFEAAFLDDAGRARHLAALEAHFA